MEDTFTESFFKLEVNDNLGKYTFTETIGDLLEDVRFQYGKKTEDEVAKWAIDSKENEQFHKFDMCITNVGKQKER